MGIINFVSESFKNYTKTNGFPQNLHQKKMELAFKHAPQKLHQNKNFPKTYTKTPQNLHQKPQNLHQKTPQSLKYKASQPPKIILKLVIKIL